MKSKYKERNKQICIDILNGVAIAAAAGKYNLTPERGRQIQSEMIRYVDINTWEASKKNQRSCNTAYLRNLKLDLVPKIKEF